MLCVGVNRKKKKKNVQHVPGQPNPHKSINKMIQPVSTKISGFLCLCLKTVWFVGPVVWWPIEKIPGTPNGQSALAVHRAVWEGHSSFVILMGLIGVTTI